MCPLTGRLKAPHALVPHTVCCQTNTNTSGGVPPWLVVPFLRSCQSPIWTWLVHYLHLHLHLRQNEQGWRGGFPAGGGGGLRGCKLVSMYVAVCNLSLSACALNFPLQPVVVDNWGASAFLPGPPSRPGCSNCGPVVPVTRRCCLRLTLLSAPLRRNLAVADVRLGLPFGHVRLVRF